MSGPSRITTTDGIATVFDPSFGCSIQGRSLVHIEEERRRRKAANQHEVALQRWEGEGGRGPREVVA